MMRFLLFLGIAAAVGLTFAVYSCLVVGARSEDFSRHSHDTRFHGQ